MTSTRPDGFNHALNTANTWLADIGAALNTDDRHFSRRALRAWLHTLRDRLSVDVVAKFGAQLPELIRGMLYDGWNPSPNPVKYGVDEYTQRFAWEARMPIADVPAVASAVTLVLSERMSSGQMHEALAAFPADLRDLIQGSASIPAPQTAHGQHRVDRLSLLQDQVNTLAEAVRSLARGMQDHHLAGVDAEQVTRGAQLADEILMSMRK